MTPTTPQPQPTRSAKAKPRRPNRLPCHEIRFRGVEDQLGITKAKKRLKKELGITAALKPFRAWTNAKRRFKRKIGYESKAGRLIRSGLPRPGGCLVVIVAGTLILATIALAVAR
jgi:hypothetical protein